jgi:drug/metabolite transporter (DMT)-like permease
MGIYNLTMLVLLSAIWGSSFMFMRYLSPILGAITTAGMRLFIGGTFLVLFFLVIRFKPEWRKNWKHFLFLGIMNSGLPFLCYSFASLYLPAAMEAILNATSPMWSALFGVIRLGESCVRKADRPQPRLGGP